MYGNGTELHQEVFGPKSSDTVNYSTMKHPKTQSGVLESRNVLFLVLDASGISSTCHAHVAQRILTLYSLRICKRFPVQYTDIPYFPIKSLTWGSASSHASSLFVVLFPQPSGWSQYSSSLCSLLPSRLHQCSVGSLAQSHNICLHKMSWFKAELALRSRYKQFSISQLSSWYKGTDSSCFLNKFQGIHQGALASLTILLQLVTLGKI